MAPDNGTKSWPVRDLDEKYEPSKDVNTKFGRPSFKAFLVYNLICIPFTGIEIF
jgi:hypothetical protein